MKSEEKDIPINGKEVCQWHYGCRDGHDDCEWCYRNSEAPRRPKIVCLCGSTRFYEEFQRANFTETLAGNIVLTVGFYPHAKFSEKAHGEDVGITSEEKIALDNLHKRKIDLADEVFVLNVGGYVGDSTRSEILYAMRAGKDVRWLELFGDAYKEFAGTATAP